MMLYTGKLKEFAEKKGADFYNITNETLKTVGPILFVTAAGGVLDLCIADTCVLDSTTITGGANMQVWKTGAGFLHMMKVNTGSAFLGCKYAIPVMRKQGGGVIINTSSVCGLVGHKYTPEAYTASKGAVTMLTKAVASRYAKDGVRCNSIHPSTVDTPFVQVLFKDPERKAERLGEVPLGRLATAADVANAVLYLASEEASFINGVALPVDGGVTCY